MKRLKIVVAALALVLAGCSSGGSTAEEGLLADHDLAGMEVTEVIDHLDRLGGAERPTDLMASVGVDELMLSDGSQEVALDLPDDRFYLSVAPYVNQTHECYYHSLTACQGQLEGEDVQVTVRDDRGEVLVDEEMTTFENGFVGLWLPRNVEGTIQISSADGRTGEVPFSTGDEAATCLTTLRLV